LYEVCKISWDNNEKDLTAKPVAEMIDQETADAITQKKLDALCAKHLHIKPLDWLRKWNRGVD
jgi:hypothetical protein